MSKCLLLTKGLSQTNKTGYIQAKLLAFIRGLEAAAYYRRTVSTIFAIAVQVKELGFIAIMMEVDRQTTKK